MAIKYQSKYTGREIEALLDSIQPTLIKVDKLPEVAEANHEAFYMKGGEIYYIDDKNAWTKLNPSTGEGGQGPDSGAIDAEEHIKPAPDPEDPEKPVKPYVLDMNDFVATAAEDGTYTLKAGTDTENFIKELDRLMTEGGKTVYRVDRVDGRNFINDNKPTENDVASVESSNVNGFCLKVHLVNLKDVNIIEQKTDPITYLIEFEGIAL